MLSYLLRLLMIAFEQLINQAFVAVYYSFTDASDSQQKYDINFKESDNSSFK